MPIANATSESLKAPVFSVADDGAGELLSFIPSIVVVDVEQADRVIVVARTPAMARVDRSRDMSVFQSVEEYFWARGNARKMGSLNHVLLMESAFKSGGGGVASTATASSASHRLRSAAEKADHRREAAIANTRTEKSTASTHAMFAMM